jgi:recombination protein RecA
MGRKKGGTNKNHSSPISEPTKIVNNPMVEKNNNQINQEKREIDINLKRVTNELTKTFGHSIIHFASEEPERERIPTGIEQIDKLLGGGISEGMFNVIWGNKSSTKTTLSYLIISQAQKRGKTCLYIDLERSFDKIYAEKMGVDLNRLLVAQFDVAEETFDSIIKLCNEKCVNLIVLDSIQSLSPKGEKETKTGKEKSVEDDTFALLARKLSQFFRMTANGVAKGKVAILLIGQARTNLGSFIKLDALSGGHALQHWAAITLKAYRGSKADAPRYKFKVNGKSKEIVIGFSLNIKIEKTKVSGTAPEDSFVTIPFYYEYAFNKPSEEQIKELYKDWISFEEETDEK